MVHNFAAFEIDEDKRELRAGDRTINLQPRVFDLLVYLARNRERVVPKDELLDAVWPGVIVADGALQRAVSLARNALADAGVDNAIRTFAGRGYRLVVEPAGSAAVGTPAPPGAPEPPPPLARLWAVLSKPGLDRSDLEMADELGRQAVEVRRDDADAWAAWSHVDTWYVYHAFDSSTARRESARTKAARALQLAPTSYEARLAHACYLVRCSRHFRAPLRTPEVEILVRGLLAERPDEPRALFTLAILQRNAGRWTDAEEALDRLARDPAFAAVAFTEKGWLLTGFQGRYREGLIAAGKALALSPSWSNLGLRIYLAQVWEGDLDLALATLQRMPAAILLEDWGAFHAWDLHRWRREPEPMLEILDAIPRDWLSSNAFTGPRRLLAGVAHAMAGRREAAVLEWRAALALEDRREDQPPGASELPHYRRGLLLAWLGRRDEAAGALRLYREYGGAANIYDSEIPVEVLLGDLDGAMRELERRIDAGFVYLTAANLRLNPDFDPLRTMPRFEHLLARLSRDPRFSPSAP